MGGRPDKGEVGGSSPPRPTSFLASLPILNNSFNNLGYSSAAFSAAFQTRTKLPPQIFVISSSL